MLDGFLYVVVLIFLVASFVKDRQKTRLALKKAWKSLLKNLIMMMGMMILMGVVFVLVHPDTIGKLFGKDSGIYGVLIGLGIGSVSFIPSFIAFPLGAELIEKGAGYPQVAAFISSLMGVGIISLGMEVEYFGRKAAILRNGIALMASLCFVLLVGGVM